MKKFILFIKITFTLSAFFQTESRSSPPPSFGTSFSLACLENFSSLSGKKSKKKFKVLTITSRDPLEADPDRNGLSNVAEYALGMIPDEPSTLQRPWLRMGPDRSVSLFLPRARWLPEGIEFEVFCSEDLREWVPINRSPSVENLSETQDLLRYSVGSAEGKRFYWIVIQSRE